MVRDSKISVDRGSAVPRLHSSLALVPWLRGFALTDTVQARLDKLAAASFASGELRAAVATCANTLNQGSARDRTESLAGPKKVLTSDLTRNNLAP